MTCNMCACIILMEDGTWLTSKIGAQPLDVRCQKCFNLHSNYCWFEFEMCMSCTQWLSKPSHEVQIPYTNIECKEATCIFLRASRHITTIKILHAEFRLVWKWHCTIPVSSFVRHCPLSHHFSVCCIIKESQSNDRWADRPHCCKCNHTIQVETGHAAKMSISRIMVHDVIIQFRRLTSQYVCPLDVETACCSVWPSAAHWFHICMIVVEC